MEIDLTPLLKQFRPVGKDVAVVQHIGVRRRITRYKNLAELAERVAALLVERGIAGGERFVLPRPRDFQRSFQHAGRAVEAGFHVVVFPEKTRSARGELARFRPGIGLLVANAARRFCRPHCAGLVSRKRPNAGGFRCGSSKVSVDERHRFSSLDSEAAVTQRLHLEVQKLLHLAVSSAPNKAR
jgi:hypothetical protein